MYTVSFDTEAIEFLSKLPPKIKERIFNKIISTKENPNHYRIIADISLKNKTIQITLIGHRKNVYKNL